MKQMIRVRGVHYFDFLNFFFFTIMCTLIGCGYQCRLSTLKGGRLACPGIDVSDGIDRSEKWHRPF